MSVAFTPYVSTLQAPLETAIREALGLEPNVKVRLDNRGRDRTLRFDVLPPNDLVLPLQLSEDDRGWVRAGGLSLGVRCDPDDPALAPSLTAVAKLFARAQRRDGARLRRALWTAFQAFAPFVGLQDDYFRRVFVGPMGAVANFRLGFRCNQDCGFCWQDRRWPEPPEALYDTWFSEIAAAGITQLTLSGGEPTLHRSLPVLLERARDAGMRTLVQTNAVQLSKGPLLDRIVAARPDRLFISFHAAEAALSDQLTRAPGTWQRTVQGIDNALEAGMQVSLNCVIERANAPHLPAHARFLRTRWVDGRDTSLVSVTWSRAQRAHDGERWARELPPFDEVEPHLLAALDVFDGTEVHLDVTSGSCGLPACLLRDRTHLIQLGPPEAVGSVDPAFDESQRDGLACGRCALRSRCAGPGPAYNAVHGDRGLVPFAELPELPESFPLSF